MSNQTRLSTDQIAELTRIDKVRFKKDGRGIGPDVQQLIARLNDGGIGAAAKADERERQAKVLWDLGMGREMHYQSFETYLGDIPPIPDPPSQELEKSHFFLPVLIDSRTSLFTIAIMAHVNIPRNTKGAYKEPCWIYCRMTEVWRGSGECDTVGEWLETLKKDGRQEIERGVTLLEGLHFFLQYPAFLSNKDIEYALPGDLKTGSGKLPLLTLWDREPKIVSHEVDREVRKLSILSRWVNPR